MVVDWWSSCGLVGCPVPNPSSWTSASSSSSYSYSSIIPPTLRTPIPIPAAALPCCPPLLHYSYHYTRAQEFNAFLHPNPITYQLPDPHHLTHSFLIFLCRLTTLPPHRHHHHLLPPLFLFFVPPHNTTPLVSAPNQVSFISQKICPQ